MKCAGLGYRHQYLRKCAAANGSATQAGGPPAAWARRISFEGARSVVGKTLLHTYGHQYRSGPMAEPTGGRGTLVTPDKVRNLTRKLT